MPGHYNISPPDPIQSVPDASGTSRAEERPDPRLMLACDISHPAPEQIQYLPTLKPPSNGMLAAQQVIPFAQYDLENDFEFFAKGATLVVEDEERRPTYYRGNATIRISDRDRRPGPKPPTRLRLNHMQNRLFRMGQYSKEDTHENSGRSPDAAGRLRQLSNDSTQQSNAYETRGDEDKKLQDEMAMTRTEFEAVVTELAKDARDDSTNERTNLQDLAKR